jgi:hypothetical protein
MTSSPSPALKTLAPSGLPPSVAVRASATWPAGTACRTSSKIEPRTFGRRSSVGSVMYRAAYAAQESIESSSVGQAGFSANGDALWSTRLAVGR